MGSAGAAVSDPRTSSPALPALAFLPGGTPNGLGAIVADAPCMAAREGVSTPQEARYYYRARYYDPRIGRFISEDPMKFGAGPNYFAYADNDPVDKVDPLGLSGWRIEWRTCAGQVMREVTAGYCGNGMNANNDPSCRVAHCMANCTITRECVAGRVQAAAASYAKEAWDWGKKKTWDPTSEGYSHGDQCANKRGRDDAKKHPEKTCEELCKNVR